MMANRRQSTGVSTAGAGHAGVTSYRLDLIASVQQGYTFSPNTRHLTLILRYSVTFHDWRIGDGTYACDTARGQSDH